MTINRAWGVASIAALAFIVAKFSPWIPPPISRLVIAVSVVAYSISLVWIASRASTNDREYQDFRAAMSEPLEGVSLTTEQRQQLARMRMVHSLQAAQRAAINAGQKAMHAALFDLETLYSLEAIPALGEASERTAEIVKGLEPSEDLP